MKEYQNLIKSGQSADLGTAIQNLINDNLRNIQTAFLAEIVTINRNTLDIRPILRKSSDEKILTINNCLIAFNYSQNWSIQHKLKIGDIGIALVIQNDISSYKEQGKGGINATRRFKDANDAIYIPLSLYNSFSNDDINYQIKDLSDKCLFEFTNDFDNNLKAINITSTAEKNTTINSGENLTISTQGKNSINSEQDTEIISKANIKAEAQSNADINAQNITINAKTNATIQAPMVAIQSQGSVALQGQTLNISSSGGSSLKGELSKLADLLESLASGMTGVDGHGHASQTAPSSIGKFKSWANGLSSLLE